MSQWTHVSGVIRLDGIDHNNFERNMDRAFNSDIPWGSEGSLNYKAIYTGDIGPGYASINIGLVTIWGDLRDKGIETSHEVLDWVQEALECLSNTMFPRAVNILVEIEFGPHYLITTTKEGDGLQMVVLEGAE